MPPSDSRLKVTMSPCLRLTSSTQSFGRETMRVEYPTFWTFRASLKRYKVYTFYTKHEKKVGYIRELQSMVFLYLARETQGPVNNYTSLRAGHELETLSLGHFFHSLRGRFGMRLPGRGDVLTAAAG